MSLTACSLGAASLAQAAAESRMSSISGQHPAHVQKLDQGSSFVPWILMRQPIQVRYINAKSRICARPVIPRDD